MIKVVEVGNNFILIVGGASRNENRYLRARSPQDGQSRKKLAKISVTK